MSLVHGGGGPSSRRRSRGRSGGFLKTAGRAIGRIKINPRTGRPTHRRGGGITKAQLRGFHKVVNLLHKVGMTPRRLGGRAHAPRKR